MSIVVWFLFLPPFFPLLFGFFTFVANPTLLTSSTLPSFIVFIFSELSQSLSQSVSILKGQGNSDSSSEDTFKITSSISPF